MEVAEDDNDEEPLDVAEAVLVDDEVAVDEPLPDPVDDADRLPEADSEDDADPVDDEDEVEVADAVDDDDDDELRDGAFDEVELALVVLVAEPLADADDESVADPD